MFLHKVNGIEGKGGVVIYCLPNEAKTTPSGPFSAKLLGDVVDSGKTICGLQFQKPRRFNLHLDNKIQMYPSKSGNDYPARVFVILDINDFANVTKEMWETILKRFMKIMHKHKLKNFAYNKHEAVELAKNWYKDDASNVFADVLGIKQSYDMLAFNHNKTFKMRPVSAGLAENNTDTWAKQHMDLVNSYFKKGTLDLETAIKLGLTAEWVVPNELPSESQNEDGAGQNLNLASSEDSEEDD